MPPLDSDIINKLAQTDARLTDTDRRVSYLTTQITSNNNDLTKALQVISERSIVTQDRLAGFMDSYKEYRGDINELFKQVKEETNKQTRELKADHARQIESLKELIEKNKIETDKAKKATDASSFTIRSWQGNLVMFITVMGIIVIPTVLIVIQHYWK